MYVPLERFPATKFTLWLPAVKSPSEICATSCPSRLNNLIFTFDSTGNENEIVVDGLKGFG